MSMRKKYIRDKNNNPKGVLIAIKVDSPEGNYFTVGYSLCAKNDTYNKRLGMKIAMQRCGTISAWAIPRSIEATLLAFIERCKPYFKDAIFDDQNILYTNED